MMSPTYEPFPDEGTEEALAMNAALTRRAGRERSVTLRDPDAALEALADLEANARSAHYELEAAVALLRDFGVSWGAIGGALDYPAASARQAAYQRFGRRGHDFRSIGSSIGEEDAGRLHRLLGIKAGQVKFELYRIVTGARGVSRVELELVSRHVKIGTADRRADELEDRGERVEIWKLHADGRRERVRGDGNDQWTLRAKEGRR